MYTLEPISTIPNKSLNKGGETASVRYAPSTVPGMERRASFIPREYIILFCLEYDTVEATALQNAAKRLSLAASGGEKPKKVKTGTTTNPPPNPIIEPSIPAAKPRGINQRFSNNVNTR